MPILALAASSPRLAAAHWPISSPARKLSVAKVASAASIGSSGVSSAMTRRPASRAWVTAPTMDEVSEAVSRMPLAPSSDAGLDRLRPGSRGRRRSCRQRISASCQVLRPWPSAPSFILTKNGLVSVLVIRQTIVSCAAALAVPPRAIRPSAVAPNRPVLSVFRCFIMMSSQGFVRPAYPACDRCQAFPASASLSKETPNS